MAKLTAIWDQCLGRQKVMENGCMNVVKQESRGVTNFHGLFYVLLLYDKSNT